MKAFVPPLYLDLPAVAATVSLSEPSIQRLVRENSFPAPRELSNRRVAWLYREVEEWAEQRPIANNLPPENTGGRKKKCVTN
jgi:prophage regulatory protein